MAVNMAAKQNPMTPARVGAAASPQNTISLLQQRLETAEQDTKLLNDSLEQLGFPSKEAVRPVQLAQSPFKARGPPNEENALVRNYEILVSRTCRLESTIQSLKLNLCTLQAEKDLIKKGSSNTNEKLVIALEAYDREIQKNKRSLEDLRFDKKNLEEDLQSARASLEEKKKEIMQLSTIKDEAVAKSDEAGAGKQKLLKRVGDLKQELERETKMRASLEESQASLLGRVNEMEAQVEAEREQVSSLSNGSTAVKKQLRHLQDELKSESALRQQAEEVIKSQHSQLEDKTGALRRLDEEKRLLMTETGKVKASYKSMNEQLCDMQKHFEEKQETFVKVDAENRELQRSLKQAAEENAQLVARYEERMKEEREAFRSEFDSQDQVIELRERLRKEGKERDALDAQCERLKDKLSSLQTEHKSHKLESEQIIKGLREQVARYGRQVAELEEDKGQTLLAKDSLLNEVNAAVDEMTQQRASLGCELEGARVEIDVLQRTKSQLERENIRLQGRAETLESQQTSHQHVDGALKDMMEQKNKLAYDKGRLQSKVDQLQADLETLARSQSELLQLRKQSRTLEAKYTKSQTDLQALKLVINQYEAQLKQHKTDGMRKERDFSLAIESRDQAMREADKLMGHIEAVEDRERNKISALQQSLSDSRDENRKMASTLETVIQSHAQLQVSIEQLQLQLGRRDAEISKLALDKEQNQRLMSEMKTQLGEATDRLTQMETFETREVEPLRKTLEQSRTDAVKLTGNVAAMMDRNQELETKVKALEDEVEQQAYLLEQQRNARKSDQTDSEKQFRNYDERIRNLKEQVKKEREKTLVRGNKEVNEYKRLHEDLTTKNGELSRANSELRKKLMDSEDSIKDLKTKLGSQKVQLEQMIKTKKNQEGQIEGLKKANDQLRDSDKVKEKYVKRNQSQAQTIKSFTSQLTELHEQLRAFAGSQERTQQVIQQQKSEMEKLAGQNAELARMWKFEKQNKTELAELSRQLPDVDRESFQITEDANEADFWFKKQVDSLQHELEVSKKVQERFAEEAVEQYRSLEEEKRKARDIAQQAEEMLKSNRESMSRIARTAELNREETKQDMLDVYQQLAREREESKRKDEKIRRLKNSSLRQVEDLVRTMTPDNSHTSPRTSSPFFADSD